MKAVLEALGRVEKQVTPNGGNEDTTADQIVLLRREVRALSHRVDNLDGKTTSPIFPVDD